MTAWPGPNGRASPSSTRTRAAPTRRGADGRWWEGPSRWYSLGRPSGLAAASPPEQVQGRAAGGAGGGRVTGLDVSAVAVLWRRVPPAARQALSDRRGAPRGGGSTVDGEVRAFWDGTLA